MIDFSAVTVFKAGDALRDHLRYDDKVRLRQDGEGSYHTGLALSDCPPFVDEDMGVFWRMGWEDAHGCHWRTKPRDARKRCHKECPHRITGGMPR